MNISEYQYILEFLKSAKWGGNVANVNLLPIAGKTQMCIEIRQKERCPNTSRFLNSISVERKVQEVREHLY